MAEILGLLLLGLVVGSYGTLVGIGGGPLIVPMVATLYNYDTPTVIAVSTMVVFCNTLSGTVAYLREQRIDLVSATKFGLASVPGALISVMVIYHIHLVHGDYAGMASNHGNPPLEQLHGVPR